MSGCKAILGVMALLYGLVTPSGPSPLAGTVEEIQIGVSGRVAMNWPTYVLTRELEASRGSPDTRSFTIKSVRFESPADSLEALVKGAIHIWAPAPIEFIIEAYIRGAPVIVGAGYMNKAPYRLVTRNDIRRAEDLRGKTIGISRFMLAQERQMLRRLEKFNLKYNIDYFVRPVAGSVGKIISLMGHTIDGAYIASEFLYVFSGPTVGLFDLSRDLRILDAESDFLEFPFLVAAYNRDWASQSGNEALVVRVTEQLSKAFQWLKNPENRAQAIRLIVDRTGIERRAAIAVYSDYIGMRAFSGNGELNCKKVLDLVRSLGNRSKSKAWNTDNILLSRQMCDP